MLKERIYILHKNGADSHYTGLNYLLTQNNIELQYFEFSIFSKLFKSLFRFDFKLFFKQFENLRFLASLLFSKNKKIVLGIAPFDPKLLKLLPFFKKHHIYYHSSWTYWDKTFHPNKKKNTKKTFNAWASFLEDKVRHHFVVTQQTKNQLLANYKIEDSKISVVAHSLKKAFLNPAEDVVRVKNSFVYLGRLVPQKGIEEILNFFKANNECELTIVGNGSMKKNVEKTALKYNNINYKPFTRNVKDLVKEIRANEFMILNSKTTTKWEELFGLVIIESMSQGTIPIASNHSGPKEIITSDTGYLFKEGDLENCLTGIINSGGFEEAKSMNCIIDSKKYRPEKIALRWKKILE